MQRVQKVILRRCTSGTALQCNIRFAGWEHGLAHGTKAEDLALILCDGFYLHRVGVVREGGDMFELEMTSPELMTDHKDRTIAEFHVVQGIRRSLFFVFESGRLAWTDWLSNCPDSVSMRDSERLTAPRTTPRKSEFAKMNIVCAAAASGGLPFFCAATLSGVVLLIDSEGVLLTTQNLPDDASTAACMTSSGSTWVVSCASKRGASFMSKLIFYELGTLEVIRTIDIEEFCFSHLLISESNGTFAEHSDCTESVVMVSQTPPAIVLINLVSEALVSRPVDTKHLIVYRLASLLNARITSAALLAEPRMLVALGTSDGSVHVFRPSSDPFDGFAPCGRHRLSHDGLACVVATGFSAWSEEGSVGRLGLFAALESGEHHLWVMGSEPPVHESAPSSRPRRSDSDTSLAPRCPPEPASCDRPPDPVELAPRRAAQPTPCPERLQGDRVARLKVGAAVAVAREHVPVPLTSDLESLIARTARQIAELEDEEAAFARAADKREATIVLESPPIVPLEVPPPPASRRQLGFCSVTQKWSEKQRELIDPMEMSRAYLERLNRPVAKPQQPFWPPSPQHGDSVHISSVSLSFDPLEDHVRGLCQPW